MIFNFHHKGLRLLYEKGERYGVNPQHLDKIELILGVLDVAERIEDLDVPSFRLDPLKGNLKDFWSVSVRANWRIVFRFENGLVKDIDLVDYH